MSFVATNPPPAALTFGPPLENLVRTLLKAQTSEHTRRSYRKAIENLDIFAEGRPVTRLLLLDWRRDMQRGSGPDSPPLSPATINLRLTAVRRLVREAQRARLLDANEAAELLDVGNLPQRGVRTGNWLTASQAAKILAVPNRNTLRGKRNYCVLAILLGCALRRSELSALEVDALQLRDDRWILENLRGKGGRVRSVAVPAFVKDAIAAWMFAAGIDRGRVIRQLTLAPEGLSDDSIMDIVRKAAAKIGVEDFSPHDLRRTCAKLCRKNGGELEQIQYMLGHASLVTTERYLGGTQQLSVAVNDSLGF